ncbi:putative transport protein MmpL2 [BD1-7 clade bacterium]|uniref:Putative transport protein MmpL2 n=1 Tax=BD1-7 clade bacterium TaxID=2029982 RepID=A0A5S9PID2_9GAMM|nr:putative transport protein MmpL2 [BD1-7 clade bacterium]
MLTVSQWIADHAMRFRGVLVLVSLVMLIVGLSGYKYFVFDSTPRAFFSADYPYQKAFDAIEDKYGKDSRVLIMLGSDDDSIFTPETLAALSDLTEQGWQLPGVLRVDSLSNYQHSRSDGDDVIIDELYDPGDDLDAASIARIKHIAMSSPDLVDYLVNPAGTHASVILTLSKNDSQTHAQAEETATAEAVYALKRQVEADYPGVKLWITGNAISNYHNLTIATKDIVIMVPIMFALMFVMIGLLMRSVAGVTVSLCIALLATISALGYAAMMGTVFSTLAINAVMIGITVSIAHCIHMVAYFLHSYAEESKADAIRTSLQVNFVPVSITSLTTALGFLSLNFTDLPPAAHLGNASALAVFFAWLYSYTVLPALLTVLPVRRPKTAETNLVRIMTRLANWVIRWQRAVLVSCAIISVVMVGLAMQNTINDRFSEMIKKPHEFRTDNDAIDAHFGGLYNVFYDMQSGEENGVTDLVFIDHVDTFVDWLRAQPEVSSVHAYTDILKRLNKSLHGDKQQWYRSPDNSELAAQLLLMYEFSVPQGASLDDMIALDKSSTRILINTPSMDTDAIFAFQDKVNAWQAEHLPEAMRYPGASLAIMWSHLSIDSLVSSIEGSFVALVIISAVLMVVLGSFRYGLISIVPNLIPAAIGFGVWAIISGELGLGLTTVVILTMGIIVDDTVHFLSKYQFARKHQALNAEDAVRFAFRRVGTPIWITTAALASGFAILTLSKIHGNSDLGLLTSIILVAALILDFLLLPALLFVDSEKKVA